MLNLIFDMYARIYVPYDLHKNLALKTLEDLVVDVYSSKFDLQTFYFLLNTHLSQSL